MQESFYISNATGRRGGSMTVKELIKNLLEVEDLEGEVLVNVDGEKFHLDDTLHGYDYWNLNI